MLIDLTQTVTDNMPVYPGDQCARLYQTLFIEKDGLSDHLVESSMHVGTHMDAPLHMIDGGVRIADIPLSRCFGRGHLIDARGRTLVTAALLEEHDIKVGDIVLVWTNWSQKFHEADYFNDYPEVAEDFAQALVDKGVAILGLDTPSPDREPYAIHKILLGHDVLIIENLTNLVSLAKSASFHVHAYPVKFVADAAPVRVVAETNA